MKTTKQYKIIFIHGLESSGYTSGKFKTIKNHFTDAIDVLAFEWNQNDFLQYNIKKFIEENYSSEFNWIIIGSSAGAKLATLFKHYIKEMYSDFTATILLNPLGSVEYRTEINPKVITNDFLSISELFSVQREMLIIYSDEDEMINQKLSIKTFDNKNQFAKVIDNHRLSNTFKENGECIDLIEAYLYHINF